MITCPSCSHQNPDGATHCEACYTPLPVITMIACPSCGSSVQSDASFCGHCGFDLQSAKVAEVSLKPREESGPLQGEGELNEPSQPSGNINAIAIANEPDIEPEIELEAMPPVATSPDDLTEISATPHPASVKPIPASNPQTQLQKISAALLHVQTNITLELPNNLQVIHMGKPNNLIPPDIDVSGFPDSDIVSRVHADIRYEGDAFYFEDTGSSNGTYVNNVPLPAGNRHRLRPGDRISLGKGDKVSFIFQMSD
jgi:hypothetical protein